MLITIIYGVFPSAVRKLPEARGVLKVITLKMDAPQGTTRCHHQVVTFTSVKLIMLMRSLEGWWAAAERSAGGFLQTPAASSALSQQTDGWMRVRKTPNSIAVLLLFSCFSAPASRAASSPDFIFHLLVPPGFNHASVAKQTNKFRAFAADTNIDMSYEIQGSWERLWSLMRNIWMRRSSNLRSCSRRCSLTWRGGAHTNKMIIIISQVLNVESYGATVRLLEVSHRISRSICLVGLAARTWSSDVCVWHPPLPIQHTSGSPSRRPSVRASAGTSAFHCTSLRTWTSAGTSAVSLLHLTQHLGDLKERGENYRKWCVTNIKKSPQITTNYT